MTGLTNPLETLYDKIKKNGLGWEIHLKGERRFSPAPASRTGTSFSQIQVAKVQPPAVPNRGRVLES